MHGNRSGQAEARERSRDEARGAGFLPLGGWLVCEATVLRARGSAAVAVNGPRSLKPRNKEVSSLARLCVISETYKGYHGNACGCEESVQ